MKQCSVPECTNPYHVKGYCCKHYTQMRTYGKILERTKYTPNDFLVEGSICKIGCYNNQSRFVGYALIDTWNISKCEDYKWYFTSNGYIRSDSNGGIFLHHLILGIIPSRSVMVDHKNDLRWDNREGNLQTCTNKENMCKAGMQRNNVSGYKGVCWSEQNQCWFAQIGNNGIHYRLGNFQDKETAALAYNKAAKELHGEFAFQNIIKPKLLIRRKHE